MIPGSSVSFRISRITEGFIRSVRAARRQGLVAHVGLVVKELAIWRCSRPADRHRPADEDGGDDGQREGDRRRVEPLAEHRHREQHRQERLDQLHLADPHRAAERQAAVPGEEAEPHREHGDVGEAAPGRGARRLRRQGQRALPAASAAGCTPAPSRSRARPASSPRAARRRRSRSRRRRPSRAAAGRRGPASRCPSRRRSRSPGRSRARRSSRSRPRAAGERRSPRPAPWPAAARR